MAKINDVYDIRAAFEAIENELMSSMIRNMKRHKAEESDENGDEEAKTVATPVKVIVLSLAACVGAGIFYVLIIDKK